MKILQKAFSVFLTLLIILGTYIPNVSFAEGNELNKVKITKIRLTERNGNPVSGKYGYWNKYRLILDWDAKEYGDTIKEGDYFNIILPNQLKFPKDGPQVDLDLTDDSGNVIAKAHIYSNTDGGGTVKITFTDKVNNTPDIIGEFYSDVTFAHKHTHPGDEDDLEATIGDTTISTTIQIAQEQDFEKWGGEIKNTPNEVQWAVRLNHKKKNYNNLNFKDELLSRSGDLPDGIHYIRDSFVINEVEMNESGEIISVLKRYHNDEIINYFNFSDNDTKFTFNFDDKFGPINGRSFMIYYKSTYELGRTLINRLQMFEDNTLVKQKDTHFKSTQTGGGSIGDFNSRIKIIKIDKETLEKLPNAKFQITNDSGVDITVETKANGEVFSSKLIPGKYKVKEIQAPTNEYELDKEEKIITVYKDETTLLTITNSKKQLNPNITIIAKKVWEKNGYIGNIKDVYFELYNRGNVIPGTKTKYEGTDITWNVPLKDALGTNINYYVQEVNENGQLWKQDNFSTLITKENNIFTVTNSYTPQKIKIKGIKVWKNTQYSTDPIKNTYFQLYADDTPVAGHKIKIDKTNLEAEWTVNKLDNLGEIINYEIKEVDESGQLWKQDNWTTTKTIDTQGNYIITNTFNPKISINVKKIWGNITETKPTIKIELIKNGNKESEIDLVDGETDYTWKNLEKIDSSGNAYSYTIKEVGETNNEIKIDDKWYKVKYGGDLINGFTIINKKLNSWTPIIEPAKRNITVTKVWIKYDNSIINPPTNEVSIELYKNNFPTGNIKKLNESNNWTATFENLSISETVGSEVFNYTIKEVGDNNSEIKIDDKWYNISYVGDMKDGFTVINKQKSNGSSNSGSGSSSDDKDKPNSNNNNQNNNTQNNNSTNNQEENKNDEIITVVDAPEIAEENFINDEIEEYTTISKDDLEKGLDKESDMVLENNDIHSLPKTGDGINVISLAWILFTLGGLLIIIGKRKTIK